MNGGYEPKIVVFCCNWCSSAGTGPSRLNIKPKFRIIRTKCSGRVKPKFILYYFSKGADGVMVAGCYPGDCQSNGGNYKAKRRIALLKNMLPQLGIEPERLRLEWFSPSEAPKFQTVVNDFIDEIAGLGPLSSSKKKETA